MQLVLTEDQELLAKTAADFVAENSPVSRVRELRDSNDTNGYSPKLWKQMAELGWLGVPYPESLGGADMGLSELVVILEELGKTLAPEPFLSSVLLGGQAVLLAGSDAQKKGWLPALVEGDKRLALANQEPGVRFDLNRIGVKATRDGDHWKLSGAKTSVIDGVGADGYVIVARTSGENDAREGISLFLAPAATRGLSVESLSRVDSRNAANLTFDDMALPSDALLGAEGEGLPILETVVDRATVGLCAEMLGAMTRAFEDTNNYLKERTQFGVPIGSFQALKHRAAEMFIEVELSRSAVMAAARAVDGGAKDAAKLVSLAKARCSDAIVLVTNEAVQMFGGVGMTDEFDIGFYMKRGRVAELTFGDASFHRARWARLSEY